MLSKTNNKDTNNSVHKYPSFHQTIQYKPSTKKEFNLILSKTKSPAQVPYASYYSSKEFQSANSENIYTQNENNTEEAISPPINIAGKRSKREYRCALKKSLIKSFIYSVEQKQQTQPLHIAYKNALSISSSYLEVLKSNENSTTNDNINNKYTKTDTIKNTSMQCSQVVNININNNNNNNNSTSKTINNNFIPKTTTQMIYIKTKPKPCSINSYCVVHSNSGNKHLNLLSNSNNNSNNDIKNEISTFNENSQYVETNHTLQTQNSNTNVIKNKMINEPYSTRGVSNKRYIDNSISIIEHKPTTLFHKKSNVKFDVIDMKVKEIRKENLYNKLTNNTNKSHNKSSNKNNNCKSKKQYILKSKKNNNNISHMKYPIKFELGNFIGVNSFTNKNNTNLNEHNFLTKHSNIYNKLNK